MKAPRVPQRPFNEQEFRRWYRNHATSAGIDPDPDNPLHKYDYRAAYRAGYEPEMGPDGLMHWPSEFKSDDHPNRFVGGMDTKYGKPAAQQQRTNPADMWEQMVDQGMSEDEATAAVQEYLRKQSGGRADFSDVESGSASRAVPGKKPVGMGKGLLMSALQGATFGFADEIAGAMAPPGLRKASTRAQRETLDQFREEHPKSAFAAEVAGGLAVPGVGAAKGVSSLSKVQRLLGSAAGAGALTGAAYGAGTGEDLGDRAQKAVVGAGLGAATGAIGGAVAERLGRSKSLRKVANALGRKGDDVSPRATIADFRETPRERALRYVDDALLKDKRGGLLKVTRDLEGTPWPAPSHTEGAVDDPRLLLNMGGLNTARAARVAQTVRSEATEDVPRAIYTQLEGAPERSIADIERALGRKVPNRMERLDELQAEATKAATPLYDRIRNVFLNGEDLKKVASRPAVQDALEVARMNLLNRGEAIPDGLTVGLVDDAKKVLDAEIESIQEAMERGMARGKDKARLSSLESARKALVDEVDKLAPDYQKARAVAQSHLAPKEAFREGTKFSRTRAPEVEYRQGARTPAEREAYREGALTDIAEVVGATKDRRTAANRLFASDAERNKLQAALKDKPSALAIVEDMFTRERDLRRQATEALVPGQSMTSVNARDVAEFAPELGAIHLPVTRPRLLMSVADYFGNKAARLYQEKIRGMNQEAANELGRLLITRAGDKVALRELIEEAERAALKRASRQATRIAGARSGGVVAGATAARVK